jgi:hypothetical protein
VFEWPHAPTTKAANKIEIVRACFAITGLPATRLDATYVPDWMRDFVRDL